MNNFQSRIQQNLKYTYFLGFIAPLLDAAFSVVLARLATIEEFGTYSVMVYAVAFCQVPISLGLETVVARYVPDLAGRGEWIKVTKMLRFAAILRLMLAGIIGIFLIVFWNGLASVLNIAELTWHFRVCIAVVLVSSGVTSLLGPGALNALLDQKWFRAIGTGYSLGRIFIFGALLWGGGGLKGIITAWISSQSLLLLAYALRLQHLLRNPPKQAVSLKKDTHNPISVRRISKFAFWACIGPANSFLLGYGLDVLILSIYTSVEAVALYTIASRVAGFVFFAIPANTLYPIVQSASLMQLKGSQDIEAIRSLSGVYLKMIMHFGFPVLVVAAILGEPIIVNVFGQKYNCALPAYYILLLSYAWWMLHYPLNLARMITERMSFTIWNCVGTGFNLFAAFFLAPKYGIIGVAAATAMTKLILVFIYFLYFHQFVPLDLRSLLRTLKMTTIIAASCWLITFISNSWITAVLLTAIVCTGVWVLIERFFHPFSGFDKKLLVSLFGEKFTDILCNGLAF